MAKIIPLSRGLGAIVDDEDYEWLMQWRWHTNTGGKTFYAVRNIRMDAGRKTLQLMHRLILQTPAGLVTDHIDGNGLNNQRTNLRVCKHRENICNRRAQVSASPFKGVFLNPGQIKEYRARIKLNGKTIHLGSFLTEIEAARAYDAAAREYHGEFARLNFPDQ